MLCYCRRKKKKLKKGQFVFLRIVFFFTNTFEVFFGDIDKNNFRQFEKKSQRYFEKKMHGVKQEKIFLEEFES